MDVWYSGDYAVSFYEYGDEENPIGEFIGHTWRDWSLIPTVRPFAAPPTRKSIEKDGKGINGKIDMSNQLLGFPLYNNREGSWTFYITDKNDYDYILDSNNENIIDSDGDPIKASGVSNAFQDKYSHIANSLHGKNVAIILDEDPSYFYHGVVYIEDFVSANDDSLNGFTIKYDLYPYKIKIDETSIIIKNGSINRLGENISFKVGKMPVIPYLRVKKNVEPLRRYKLGFSNPEIADVNQDVPGVDYYNFTVPKMIVSTYYSSKLTAQYTDGNRLSKSRMSFLCSNFYGNNNCSIIFNEISNSSSNSIEYAELVFREGSL